MNLNKILVISFLILMISTYQTNSGIIFSLLLKVLLLKGALFMTMPLSIGAFMMGQGMGFFAGNMMGGYMMLRAANRYHYKEKAKWTSPSSGYGGGEEGHYGGWQPSKGHTFHNAYDKGKDIGSALHALAAHKNKLASAFHKVKTYFGRGKPPPPYKGWGWGSSGGGYSSHYGSHSSSPVSYSHSHDDHDYDHGFKYGAPSKYKPSVAVTTTKYGSYNPYGHLKNSGGYRFKGYGSGSGYPISTGSSGSTKYGSSGYKISSGVPKDQSNYASNYPSESYQNHDDSSSSYDTVVPVDPSDTHYNSAYGGPGHEYTGILTYEDLVKAQEKSSSEDDGLLYTDVTEKPFPTDSTISPNPILEKYLEQRLQEEASKNKNSEQQLEAQQLIQMLRKAYLKQLVDSLKEEEVVDRSSSSTEGYSSAGRGSRSIEDFDKNNIIRTLLSFKVSKPMESSEKKNSKLTKRADRNDEATTTTPSTTSTSTTSTINTTNSDMGVENGTKVVNDLENLSNSPEAVAQITENYISSTEKASGSDSDLNDFMEMPVMWIRTENTFVDENQPFTIRVRRSAGDDQISAPSIQTQSENKNVQSIADAEQQINSFVDDIKKFFTLLNVLDQDQCLQKLVCDVHSNQKDASTLTQYELNILTTFRLMKAVMPEGDEDSTTKYRRAALIGETGQSLELCQQSYSSCGYSSSQIISLGSQTEASAADWTGEADAASGRSDFVTMPRVRRNLRSFYL